MVPHFFRRLAPLLLALLTAVNGCGNERRPAVASAPLSVMTFNVLCSFCDRRNYDPWEQRLPYFGDIFARYDPDLIGLQELTPLGDEVAQVLAQAPGRSAIYYRPATGAPYPDAVILYRTSRFTLVEQGEYWLSPTPDVPVSTGFAPPQLPRLLVWARLVDHANGDREIYVASTHFDNNSPSQQLSAPLVLQRTTPFLNGPVIVVGDFNSRPDSTAYALLTSEPATGGFVFQNSYDLAAEQRVITNQDPIPAWDSTDRIDHIFLAGNEVEWSVRDWSVDLTVYGPLSRYPSDHFAVAATVEYSLD